MLQIPDCLKVEFICQEQFKKTAASEIVGCIFSSVKLLNISNVNL